METSVQRHLTHQSYRQAEEIVKDTPKPPSPLSSAKTKFEKKLAVIKHQSRFAKKKYSLQVTMHYQIKHLTGGKQKEDLILAKMQLKQNV